ncbi:MAG: helix-turn-helix transcriptional regulator [Clostridia bacterium]|nr:helix-turn-helix transcriptional regulator [Clostridia bacterium]
MNLGERLFELRKAKSLTQDEVAEKLNVTRQTVSKWETNQSTPDFDKIVPISELFEIGVEELLTGKKEEKQKKEEVQEEKVITKQEAKEKSAKVVSGSIFIYILAVALIMILVPVKHVNPIVASSIFLILIGWATARIIKNYMSMPKFEKTKEEKKEEKIIKQINGIIGSICVALYFIISFTTMAWHVTWVIFIINGLICQAVKLIFMLKGDEKDE